MDVQSVTSPGGISAWLVEDYSEPMFSLRFAFPGGSAQDPPGKEGLGNFLTLLLGYGAGNLNAVEFARASAWPTPASAFGDVQDLGAPTWRA